ncbi:MAG: hypothetical protein H7235_04395, partial [Bdellovibrionaceae bacterium]|nr:hypothetical protein [Pseudobdellovibrionaceae bacterium]
PQAVTPGLTSLDAEADFNAATTLSEGFVKGAVVKFLIDNRTSPAKVYFINGNYLDEKGQRPEYVQYHYYFAQKQLSVTMSSTEFNDQTYFTNNLKQKHFIAGTLQKYNVLQDGQINIFYGIQFYSQDYISDESILFTARTVNSSLHFDKATIKVVSSGLQQKVDSVKNQLYDLNMGTTSIDKIFAGIPFIPMQSGVAYGYLRLNPKVDALAELLPTDIPVFDELPLDLSVVSGVITTIVQDAGSHVNLKSKERHTPNMVLRDPQ